jgi:hypothetical protein
MCPFSLSYPSLFGAIFLAFEIPIHLLQAKLRTMLGWLIMAAENIQRQWGVLWGCSNFELSSACVS